MDWKPLIAVGCGGFVGAVSRYALGAWIARRFPHFTPAGTLCVNVLGCFLIGVLLSYFATKEEVYTVWRLALVTGLLGSLTTFSTFGYETVQLFTEERYRAACFNVAANLVLGLAAVCVGCWMIRR